jgi:hypothetical protein
MARYFVKQPNGKYCIFSTCTDYIEKYNLTKEELMDYEKERAINYVEKQVNEELNKPYMEYTEMKDSLRVYDNEKLKEVKVFLKILVMKISMMLKCSFTKMDKKDVDKAYDKITKNNVTVSY